MFVRRRPLLRAAAIGGGAYMAGKSAGGRQAAQAATDTAQDQQIADLQAQQAQQAAPPPAYAPAPAPAPQAAARPSGGLDELQKLGDMHQQGILTDEEFEAAKQKILANM